MTRRKNIRKEAKKNYSSKAIIYFILALLGKWIIVLPLTFLGGFVGLGTIFLLIGYVIQTYFGLAFIYYLLMKFC